jgi:glycosyltransferase involved in cell wall biosynthesis
VILEAMNARLPVISTPVGAIPDTVTVPENGQLVSLPPDSRSVATAIRYYLDQPERRAAVGEHNRKYVRTEYGWDGIADEIIAKYKELVP